MSRLEYHVRHADWSSLVVVLSVLFALAAFAVANSQPALPGAGRALTAAGDAGWTPAAHDDRCATECGGDKCCTKCATVDRCCCKHKDFKCDCVKDPTRGER